MSLNEDQQHGCVFSFSHTQLSKVQARSRQKIGYKQGFDFGKQICQSEREAREASVWTRECLQRLSKKSKLS